MNDRDRWSSPHPFDVPAQFARTLERHPLARGQHQLVPRSRVAALSGRLVLNIELTEAADEHVVTGFQGVLNGFQEALDGLTGFFAGKLDGLGDPIYVGVIDLLGNKVEAEVGVAFLVAAFSAMRKASPQAGLLVLGDMSIQSDIKPVSSLMEPLQVAMDNGAKRALIPIENKRSFFDVSAEVLENVDPIFYSEDKQATFKALDLV